MKNDPNVPLDLWIVKIDETESWDKEALKNHPNILRIFGVYMVDFNSYTYYCEMTPSYFLQFLENQWDGDYSNEELNEDAYDLMLEGSGDDCYVHVYSIKDAPVLDVQSCFPIKQMGRKHWGTIETFDDRVEAFESAVEDFFGNPM